MQWSPAVLEMQSTYLHEFHGAETTAPEQLYQLTSNLVTRHHSGVAKQDFEGPPLCLDTIYWPFTLQDILQDYVSKIFACYNSNDISAYLQKCSNFPDIILDRATLLTNKCYCLPSSVKSGNQTFVEISVLITFRISYKSRMTS